VLTFLQTAARSNNLGRPRTLASLIIAAKLYRAYGSVSERAATRPGEAIQMSLITPLLAVCLFSKSPSRGWKITQRHLSELNQTFQNLRRPMGSGA